MQGDNTISTIVNADLNTLRAIAYTLIETAKLNSVDSPAWLTDTLVRIADHKINHIDELLPWHYAQV